MKVLLVGYADSGGGAAIAACRLLMALRDKGISADMGVAVKSTSNPAIIDISLRTTRPRKYIFPKVMRKITDYILALISRCIRVGLRVLRIGFYSSAPMGESFNKKTLIDIDWINNSDYDLVHLHWINRDTISIEDVARIKKPIVWTMHDSWIFCGAEHHPNVLASDDRFITGYTRDNKPSFTTGYDACRKTWERKQKSWAKCQFNVISPSRFEKEHFDKSALFRNSASKCSVIPNIIPSAIFKPLNKSALRAFYKIPKNKKVIGFGTAYTQNINKGEQRLLEALKKIKNIENYHLVIFGPESNLFTNELSIDTLTPGYISDQSILADIYNLCDVFACPSMLENLPNTCLEAMFCGVPVAAFDVGGIPDIVEHKQTGYLAKSFETEDLYNGILYCLDNRDVLSRNSLEKADRDFNNKDIAEKHIQLYQNILNV